ncbi:hypothetical protein P7K49_037964 [Saguinus oedipus]|uniref:Uncharacterized protein n=1 Tax=Saguinus oedipus TaxID=9490 RepID=A0ABQ9TDA2_SAGOE|nr:hypothetical protein P7K49_037964 [Saguinus oedipus]
MQGAPIRPLGSLCPQQQCGKLAVLDSELQYLLTLPVWKWTGPQKTPVFSSYKALRSDKEQTPDEGAHTSIHASVAPELEGIGGRYLYNETEIRSLPITYDQKLQQQLWSKSCEMTGILDVTLRYPVICCTWPAAPSGQRHSRVAQSQVKRATVTPDSTEHEDRIWTVVTVGFCRRDEDRIWTLVTVGFYRQGTRTGFGQWSPWDSTDRSRGQDLDTGHHGILQTGHEDRIWTVVTVGFYRRGTRTGFGQWSLWDPTDRARGQDLDSGHRGILQTGHEDGIWTVVTVGFYRQGTRTGFGQWSLWDPTDRARGQDLDTGHRGILQTGDEDRIWTVVIMRFCSQGTRTGPGQWSPTSIALVV